MNNSNSLAFMDAPLFQLIALSWTATVGVFFVLCYFKYDRSHFFKAVGDFFIEFSFLKRNKSILLSYAFVCIIVAIFGIIWVIAIM